LEEYKKHPTFVRRDARGSDEFNPEEFDEAREVVASVADEYAACERPDYVSCYFLIVSHLLNINILIFLA
jgi:hypothetical protein